MGLAYTKIPIRDTWSDDCIRKVHRKAAKGKKEITKIWFSLCWKKLCLRRYSFQRAVNQRDQHNEVWNCAVQKTKQEAVSTCRMPAHLGVWHRPSESLAVSYVQWEGFWCWSGFMHSLFLHVLLEGLFISWSGYFWSFKKRRSPWVARFILYTGAFLLASTEAHWSQDIC